MSSLDEKARMASHPCSSSSITLHAPSGVSASHRTPSPPADRQNALCKAMGALFLQHRVHCLEEDVAKLDRKHQLLGGRHKGRGERGAGSHAGREPSKKAGCPFQKKVEKDKSGAAGEAKSEGRAQLLVVVDASVLIYSLRSVHEWLKEGKTRIVIPEEACRTLDVLKTKDDRLGLAARKAARFIEERMVQGRELEVTLSPAPPAALSLLRRPSWSRCPKSTSSVSGQRIASAVSTNLAPGLIIQPGGARMPPVEAQTMRAKRRLEEEDLRQRSAGEKRSSEETAPIRSESVQLKSSSTHPSLQDCPIFIRETLLCALYYLQITSHSANSLSSPEPPSMALAIAYPPPQHTSLGKAEEETRYLERANPAALVDQCAAYGFLDSAQDDLSTISSGALKSGVEGATGRLVVLPTAASWLMAEGSGECGKEMHARPGGGGHAGGGGHQGEGGRCHRGGGEGGGGFHRGRGKGRGGSHAGHQRGVFHRGGGGGNGSHRGGGRGGCHRGEERDEARFP